jgi:Holliday junction resolvase RusA-like endonuclease
MSGSITFFVQGIAKPAGSKRGFALKKHGVFTGRVVITDDCKTSRDWKTDVKYSARAAYQGALITGAIDVTFTFLVTRPKGHYRTGKNAGLLRDSAPKFPTVKPDLLKLARGVEDAITGIIWRDDCLIVDEHLKKRYADVPGVRVEIKEAV